MDDNIRVCQKYVPLAALRRSSYSDGKHQLVRQVWVIYVAGIYFYLYACIFFGGPFIAFDHVNYINFLNEPFPFFFEPGYTAVSYLVNSSFNEESRFPVVFVLFTLPPALLVWRSGLHSPDGARSAMVFACVLTKSFFIGFIAQRFFFAELWVCAFLVAAFPRATRYGTLMLPGLLHFSTLTILPSVTWLNSRFSWTKVFLALAVMAGTYFYVKVFSGFQLLGYDYSRYLDPDEATGGFPVMSLLQMLALAFICFAILPSRDRANMLALIGLIFILKALFSDVEVFSRIFQIQTDLVLIVTGLRSRRKSSLLFLFCLGFLVLQMFFATTSIEVTLYHATAILNILHSL